MALAAKQVLDAIAVRMTGLPSAGVRVYTSRAWPLDKLPAWRVVTPDEDIEQIVVHSNPIQDHKLQVELRGYAEAVADLDDTLHGLAVEALTALFNPPGAPDALSALVPSKVKLSQRRIERTFTPDGQAVVGMVQITLRAEYRTKANAPEALV